MGVDILVGPNVLIPRPETELLGWEAVKILRTRGPSQVVIDMCCGSGNLACGVSATLPDTRIFACDLTDDSVDLACQNVERLRFGDGITVSKGDLFSALDTPVLADMIVCNPPYISRGRLLGDGAHLLAQEPREAFDGGDYGIAIQQRVIREAERFLKADGYLVMEFGVGQDRQVAMLARRAKVSDYYMVNDGQGRPRVLVARWIPGSPNSKT